MSNRNKTTASAGESDTLGTEAGLVNADEALAEELGLPGESYGESTLTTPEEVAQSDGDSDDVETDLNDQDGDNTDTLEEDESEEDESEEDESEEDESEEEESEEEKLEGDNLFNQIPKEYHIKVGKLLTQVKQKERAKSEARIAELSEKAAGADRVTELEAELEGVKAQKVVPAPTADSPYADILASDELAQVESDLWEMKRQLAEDPDSYMVNDPKAEGGRRYADEREQRAAAVLVDRRLLRDLPARRAWLERNGQMEASLKSELTELADGKGELSQAVNRVLSRMPSLKGEPGYRKVAVAQVLGERLLELKGKDAYSFVKRLVEAAGSDKTAGKRPTKKLAKRAPKSIRTGSAPRKSVSTSAGRGGFNESAFEAEILG